MKSVCKNSLTNIEYDYLYGLSNQEKLYTIRLECERIWRYLEDTIDFIENKHYLYKHFDVNELLVYCKSCKESYDTIQYLTYTMDN